MRIRTWLGWFSALLCSFMIYTMAIGVAGLVVSSPSAAWAQDDDDDDEATDDDDDADADADADAATDDDDDSGDDDDDDDEAAGDDDDDDDSGPSAADRSNVLGWGLEALGFGYTIVFLAISFTLVALVVMNMLAARRSQIVPVELVEGFESFLNEKRYQEAYELAKADDSFLGQVLSAGLAKLSSGYAQAIEAMQEVGEEEIMKMEHKLSYMALIGTVSPMIGLFGTVHGMIASFQEIAFSETTPKPNELAKGISTALFTTLIGLAIAIPAIAGFNILRNRIQRLTLEVGILSEGLMGRFQNVGQKKKAE
jgi:biopolymer transport protein ExbB